MTSIEVEGNEYVRVGLHGAESYGRPGAPDLPVFRKLVALPECDSVSVEVHIESSSETSYVRVLPCAWTREDPNNPGEIIDVYKEDDAVYELDQEFPGELARLTCVGHQRAQRMGVVEISPMQFDPVTGTLRVVEEADIVLRIHEAQSENPRNAGPMQNVISNVAVNLNEQGDGPLFSAGLTGLRATGGSGHVCWCVGSSWEAVAIAAIECATDYLIIVGDGLLEDAADSALIDTLATWRSTYNGYNVAVASVAQLDASPDTVDTPEFIRALIDSIYESETAAHMTDNRLGYVLLVGDAFDPQRNVVLPTYYGWSGVDTTADNTLEASDAYYYFLDDDPDADRYADVYLGRLPVDADNEDAELSNAVHAILAYEPLPPSAAWLKRVLMASGKDILGYSNAAAYENLFRNRIQGPYIPPDFTVETMHRMDYGGSGAQFSAELVDSIQNGMWVTGLINHGCPFYIRDIYPGGCFNPIDYDFLNTSMSPIVVAIACHTGDFDYYSGREAYVCPGHSTPLDPCDALTERLLVQERGAIASMGYTRIASAYAADVDLEYLFEGLFTKSMLTLGDAVTMARTRRVGDELTNLQSLRTLTFFGDPAINLRWRDVPNDSVDLAINESDVKPLTTYGYVNANDGVEIEVTVHNMWKADAESVVVDVWSGVPDGESSELLVSGCIGSVGGYAETTDTISVAQMPVGRNDLYLVVNPDSVIGEPTYENNTAHTACFSLPYDTGFPVKLVGKAYNAVTLFDVNNEPGIEVLVGTDSALVCYASDGGGVIWEFTRNTDARKNGPAVGFLHKNSSPYIVFEAKPRLYIINGQSGVAVDSMSFDDGIWNWYSALYKRSPQTVALGDVQGGDSSLEILGVKNSGLRVEARSIEGDVLWSTNFEGVIPVSGIAIGDIDGSGQEEIVVCQEDSLRVHHIGSCVPLWSKKIWAEPLSQQFSPPSVCLLDRDDDGTLEVLAKGASQVSSHHGALYMFDCEGDEIAQYGESAGGADYVAAIAAGDLDGNGGIEVVAVFGDSLLILSDDLTIVEAISIPAHYSGRGVLLSDVNGDEDLEIVVELLSDATLAPVDRQFIIYDSGLNIVGPTYHVRSATASPGVGPAIADIDGDGASELCVASIDSVLHVFEVGTGRDTRPSWPQRYNNAMMTNVLEQTVASEHVGHASLYNNVRVVADATFDSSLYVDPTATVRVLTHDGLHTGVDTSHVELWVNGPLTIQGRSERPVEFVSWNGTEESGVPGSWFGIFVTDTAGVKATVNHCEIRDAGTGLSTHRDMDIANCVIENCSAHGVAIAYADSVTIRNSAILDCEDLGINLLGGSSLKISSTVISGCDVGIDAYSGARLYADSIAVINSDMYGVWLEPGSLSETPTSSFNRCIFKFNDIGVFIDGTTPATSDITSCVIDSNATVGVYCDDSDDVVLINNAIKHSATGVIGLRSDMELRRGNYIAYNGEGLRFQWTSEAVVESTEVVWNDNVGIVAESGANPDVGHESSGMSVGYNLIHHNTPHLIENFTDTVTVMAEVNWWKGVEPSPNKFVGSVDYDPWIEGETPPDIHYEEIPGQVSPFVPLEDEASPSQYSLSYNYPNPFNPVTTFSYEVPRPGGDIEIVLYNVAGQTVASLVREYRGPGVYKVTWGGESDRGERVASGVYFVRMRAGSFEETRKIILLK